jgi:hypothetical protein
MFNHFSPGRCLSATLVLVAILALLASCSFPGASVAPMTVSFGDGKCTYAGPKQVPLGQITVNLNDDGRGHTTYGVWIATLDPGKTLDDVKAEPTGDAPPWVHEVDAVGPAPAGVSITHITDLAAPLITEVKQGDAIYVLCFTRQPLTPAGNWGSITVGK